MRNFIIVQWLQGCDQINRSCISEESPTVPISSFIIGFHSSSLSQLSKSSLKRTSMISTKSSSNCHHFCNFKTRKGQTIIIITNNIFSHHIMTRPSSNRGCDNVHPFNLGVVRSPDGQLQLATCVHLGSQSLLQALDPRCLGALDPGSSVPDQSCLSVRHSCVSSVS